ncbi:argininosuccinate synthase [Paenibacillus mucilaginosus]|uniref:argininosuccinate synthase domain-containing protein n=1 Tax=Paenibacillus mucilaginosus TaxID=61624 RepID=UPI003D1CBA88
MGQILLSYSQAQRHRGQKAVMLYSGGLDSMYTALMLKELGLEVHALTADVGQAIPGHLSGTASALGIRLEIADVRSALCEENITKGILANALFNDHYPISSSYTRPLIAREAVKLARKIGARLIIHSATPLQNSAARYTTSIMALAPEMDIFCPAVGEYASREEKMAALAPFLEALGIPFPLSPSLYSVDENLWARVIESGPLEDCTQDVPPHGVFEWTAPPEACSTEPLELTLELREGLPVALNGQSMPLLAMIGELNGVLGRYGIGRYTGLEDGLFGTKMPELREAPAACMIHASHVKLEEAVLSAQELRIKKSLDREWTHLVVTGGWYSGLKGTLDAAMAAFNRDITGWVRWRVSPGQMFCISRSAEKGMYVSRFPAFAQEFQQYSLNSFFQQLGRQQRLGDGTAIPHNAAAGGEEQADDLIPELVLQR